MKKKVLVTGADGFIGSHLVERLVREGISVKAFVYYNSFNSWGWLEDIDKKIMSEVEVFPGDIRDPYGVKKSLENCDSVFHLASLIAIPYSYHSPYTYVDTNIKGTLNVLQSARELDLKKIIHTSTSEVYGTAQSVPMTEKHPLAGQSPYSASKIGADQMAFSFYSSFETPVKIIRPFNTYGPRQSSRAVIPAVIVQVLSGKNEIKLGATMPTRDFNFINDTVSGFLSAYLAKEGVGEVINIGSNFEISIGDIVKLIGEIHGTDLKIVLDHERLRPVKSEVNRLFCSNKKAKELLGWKPSYAGIDGLKKGLRKTIEWFREPKNFMKYKSDIYNI